jgi:hypothetical protein
MPAGKSALKKKKKKQGRVEKKRKALGMDVR